MNTGTTVVFATLFLLGDPRILQANEDTKKDIAQNKPAAVPVIRAGVSQILVDDVRVASKSGVQRKVHPAAKLDKPVLEAEMPWEMGKEYDDGRDRRVYIYGTVLGDEETGTFRMWYNRISANFYATSSDGISWQRPSLGLVAFRKSKDNNRLPLPFHSISIIQDENDPDPARRYKAIGAVNHLTKTQHESIEARFSYRSPYPDRAYMAAYSPDGLEWTLCPNNPALPGTDTITLAQDPATGEYLAFHKRHGDPGTRPVGRQVYLSTSKDFKTWSKPELVMITDEIDHQEARKLEGGTHAEFYNMSAFPSAGQWLGLVTHFRRTGRPPVKGPGQSPHDGPIDVQLVHSRDGRKWERCEDRSPVIALGPHAYDSGSILGLCNTPVVVGDEMWMYYTAMTTTHGGYLPDKQMTIARAAWRLDGMVSLHASDSEGVIETVPIQPEGEYLTVNADVSTGRLLVEVLDAAGRVVPGYGKSACLPLTSGDVRQKVEWRAHSSLPEEKPLRLRFYLTGGDLFSYAFEKTDSRTTVEAAK